MKFRPVYNISILWCMVFKTSSLLSEHLFNNLYKYVGVICIQLYLIPVLYCTRKTCSTNENATTCLFHKVGIVKNIEMYINLKDSCVSLAHPTGHLNYAMNAINENDEIITETDNHTHTYKI